MELLLLLESSPMLYVTTVALVGLMVGSFLNVVIHRVPLMLERTWSQQCREHLELATEGEAAPAPFNLLTPGSRCPHCGHRISAIENIPVISYLALRGRCRGCGTRISLRYPVIELVTAVLSMITVTHFGFTLQAAAALAFTWMMIPLCMIDYDRQLLPDTMTLPLLWGGLLLSLGDVFVDTHTSIIGAVAGYLSLWSIYHIFRLLTGKEGMGYGDFKLLGAIGAWVGWQALPVVILFSSVVGALTGIVLIALRSHGRGQPIPFGPFLAAAGWITLLWGQDILAFYLG
jgi:leader peptidase (prepilin peptidase)/N-methyltransferase